MEVKIKVRITRAVLIGDCLDEKNQIPIPDIAITKVGDSDL